MSTPKKAAREFHICTVERDAGWTRALRARLTTAEYRLPTSSSAACASSSSRAAPARSPGARWPTPRAPPRAPRRPSPSVPPCRASRISRRPRDPAGERHDAAGDRRAGRRRCCPDAWPSSSPTTVSGHCRTDADAAPSIFAMKPAATSYIVNACSPAITEWKRTWSRRSSEFSRAWCRRPSGSRRRLRMLLR